MTMEQRSVWVQVFVYPIALLVYLAVVGARASAAPVSEISWVVPMIWTIGVMIIAIILGTIATAIAAAAGAEIRGEKAEFEDGDIRDQEIERYGDYRARHFTALGALAVIVLAMAHVDHFWIATSMFVTGTIAAEYGCIIRIRAYRQGL
ncbi:MAG: hypothetical protein CVT64_08940 [Actinobacteria bacterium HGW-Actinobacteria-4]|nr:MAG: hypothetical protein CVT64_08940 [Actinobacteria bacterium HGW-Actinobacteria-4]